MESIYLDKIREQIISIRTRTFVNNFSNNKSILTKISTDVAFFLYEKGLALANVQEEINVSLGSYKA